MTCVNAAAGYPRSLFAIESVSSCWADRWMRSTPCREALGLEIGTHVSEDCRTLYIRQKAKRGEIQPLFAQRNVPRIGATETTKGGFPGNVFC